MLGTTLVTVQTGPHGKQVNRLYIEDGSDIDKEFYLSIAGRPRNLATCRSWSRPKAAWTSRRSRTTTPEKIVTFSVDPATGIMPHHGRTWPRRWA